MDTYGLIGYPLTHSFSSKFFGDKFRLENINAKYLNFEIEDILDIRRVILFNQYLKGLNVTIPYKKKVIPFLDKISPEAEKIGAVNTIKVNRKPGDMYFYELIGYNTDYIGFKNSLLPLLKKNTYYRALILGTGGASKAIKQVLSDINIEFLNVTRSKLNNPENNIIEYAELTNEIMADHPIIINCTPLGTFPKVNNCPDIPYTMITSNHLLYDLVYNPEETLFLKRGKAQGAKTKNGKEMLELQALASWDIWQS